MGQDANGNIVCKSGITPYHSVPKNIFDSAKNMYDTDKYNSDLVNSYAWDTALLFIQKFSGEKNYAMQNVQSSEKKNCGEIGDEKCNINDMSENYLEWTTETAGENSYTYRGGEYACGRHRVDSPYISYVGASGRVIIYL